MADVNVNAPADQAPTMAPPIRTDDQILPHIRWVPMGKRNCYLDVEKSQSNPINKIIDEKWFNLTKDTLKDALQITPVKNNRAFTSPPSSDALINFINELGYPKLVRTLSNFVTNDMARVQEYLLRIWLSLTVQSWSGEKKSPVERTWEEFTQSIHTLNEDKKNLAQHTHGKKKATLIMIPSIWFTKLIIYHLQRNHKFYPRPDSLLHLPNEEHVLRYLKFSAKGTKREVFGMPIPGSLITADIQDCQKPKPTTAKADPRPPLLKLASSKQPEPKPAPAKTQRKKRNSLRYVDESVAEDILEKEPRVDDEEADMRTSTPTGSSDHNESSTLYAKLGLIESEEESDEDMLGTNAGVQAEGQAGPNSDAQDEGQTGSNPNEQAEGQAGPDPGDAEASQPLPSQVVHAGSDLEHMDLDVADVSTQLSLEQMDEGDKPSEADNNKETTETEAKSMVSVTIQQDTSLIPPMTTPIIDLTLRPKSPKVHQLLKATAMETTTTTTTTTIHQPPSQQQQSTTDSMMMNRIDEPKHMMTYPTRDLLETDMKEILHQRMWETDSYKTHEDHMQLYEALEKLMNHEHSKELANDLAEARPSRALGSPGAFGSSQVPPPPPPPPSINQKGQSKGFAAPSSSKTAASADYQAWMMTDTRLMPSISLTSAGLQMDDDMAPDVQAQSSDDVDIRNAYIPKMWIEEECKYDIAAIAVRTHMQILSVVRIEVFSMYGYDYMKKIVLRRTDLNEHVIAERDFKYLYPSDFEDLYLLNLQGHLNHLPPKDKKILTTAVNLWTRHLVIRHRVEDFQLGIESYQTQLNLTKPRWDATRFEYKHDYTIDEALNYQVKEFKINRMNPGFNIRFWTRKDVDRSKEFMFAIQKQLKTRRIFCNLESFIGGRVRDGDYRLLKRTE
nr:histone deacetylase 14 [Tanacetum cinerariifolium]